MRRAATALLGAGLVPLLMACGPEGSDGTTGAPEPTADSPSSSVTSTPTGGAEPTDGPTGGVPPFPDDTRRQMADNTGEWDLVLADVRVGSHEGFDRVVLEFTGTGSPGWVANYVDEAVQDGSGETVALAGDSVLDVYARGTTYPSEDGEQYAGPRRIESAAGGAIAEVFVVGTFEGDTQVFVAVDGEAAPFRVFALADPARLVVDVAD